MMERSQRRKGCQTKRKWTLCRQASCWRQWGLKWHRSKLLPLWPSCWWQCHSKNTENAVCSSGQTSTPSREHQAIKRLVGSIALKCYQYLAGILVKLRFLTTVSPGELIYRPHQCRLHWSAIHGMSALLLHMMLHFCFLLFLTKDQI